MINAVPFPWMGAKARWAKIVWERLGNPTVYIEPFAGSAALLLRRPPPYGKREVLIDTDGHICNFWRAVKLDADRIARIVQGLLIEADIISAAKRLRAWPQDANERLMRDDKWCDAEIAGLWCWASNFTIRNISGGFKHQMISPYGQRDTTSRRDVKNYFSLLRNRMRWVQVLNRDWSTVDDRTVLYLDHRKKNAVTGVAIDPPYRDTSNIYTGSHGSEAVESYEWAIAHGEVHRIVYFANDGDFRCPPGWDQVTLSRCATFGVAQDDDVAFFSPACIDPQPSLFA